MKFVCLFTSYTRKLIRRRLDGTKPLEVLTRLERKLGRILATTALTHSKTTPDSQPKSRLSALQSRIRGNARRNPSLSLEMFSQIPGHSQATRSTLTTLAPRHPFAHSTNGSKRREQDIKMFLSADIKNPNCDELPDATIHSRMT